VKSANIYGAAGVAAVLIFGVHRFRDIKRGCKNHAEARGFGSVYYGNLIQFLGYSVSSWASSLQHQARLYRPEALVDHSGDIWVRVRDQILTLDLFPTELAGLPHSNLP